MTQKLKLRLFYIFRRIAYTVAPLLDVLLGSKNEVVVFCYHSISHSGWRFSVTPEEFKKQIEYLLTRYRPITIGDLKNHLAGVQHIDQPSFLLTFDDGYKDVLQIKNFLAEKGVQPTMFVLSNTTNPNRYEMDNELELLDVEEVKELHASGWDIGCHSATHSDFYGLTEEEVEMEVVAAKSVLESELGMPIEWFAYPKGSYTSRVLEGVRRAGYTLAFSMDPGIINSGTNPVVIPRVGIELTHTFKDFTLAASVAIITIRKTFAALLSKLT